MLVLCGALLAAALDGAAPRQIPLAAQRSSPQDLEISGALPGFSPGASRFVRYADLSSLPQVRFTVRDDSNFPDPVQLSGVPLDGLLRALGISGGKQLIAAICSDGYEAHYPAEYRAVHHPVLVLRIAGQEPAHWPPAPDGERYGPYLISHPSFSPSRPSARDDEAQIPYAVIRLQFFDEDTTLRSLRPPGVNAPSSAAMQGYRIAIQNCLRCHRSAMIGGTKSPYGWQQIALIAKGNPTGFGKWVVRPSSVNPEALMPPNPQYGPATIAALTAYFRSFATEAKQP